MPQKIESVYLYVSDIERSARFYENILGLKTKSRGNSSAEFDLGGDRLGLRLPPPSIPPGWEGPLIFLQVDDIQMTINRLREVGVKILAEISAVKDFDDSTMKVATFYDPDGNPLHIVERQ